MTKRNFSGKGKILKIFQSENFLKIRGNLKQGGMHHGLRGMDAPDNSGHSEVFSV